MLAQFRFETAGQRFIGEQRIQVHRHFGTPTRWRLVETVEWR
jgi:hypothetical protein